MSSEQRRAARLRLGLFEVRVEKDFGHASHQKLNGRELASRIPDGASNKGNHRSSHRALPCPFFLSRVWREVLCLRYKMLASVRAHGIAVVAVDLILMPFITTKANSIIISSVRETDRFYFFFSPFSLARKLIARERVLDLLNRANVCQPGSSRGYEI